MAKHQKCIDPPKKISCYTETELSEKVTVGAVVELKPLPTESRAIKKELFRERLSKNLDSL